MNFFPIVTANFFHATKPTGRRILTACSAIARYMHLVPRVGEITVLPKREERTVLPVCSRTGGKTIILCRKSWSS